MLVEKRKGKTTEIPTASLADIVFLLLLFFLVTTTIDVDKGIGLALPEKGEQKEVHKRNITNLLINADGLVRLDKEPIEINVIKSTLQGKLVQNPLLIVSVKTDKRTSYEVYVKVLDQVKQAFGKNAPRISIAEPES
jgi:biopolymer transport protein ExbD